MSLSEYSLGGKNFWLRCYTKKVLYTLSNFALKTRYLIFQHKSLFNLVKDFFKWIEGLGRSVNVRLQSEGEKIFDLGGIRKKYLIRCQFSRSNARYIVFQHKLLFNLVKKLFKWLEGPRRSFTVWVQSEGEKIFELGAIRNKYSIRCQILRSKTRYIVFSTKIAFQTSQGLIQMNWGSREECHYPSTVWGERIFDPGAIRKKYSIRCQISRSKLAI